MQKAICFAEAALTLAVAFATLTRPDTKETFSPHGPSTDPRPSTEFLTSAIRLAKWIDEHSDFGPMERHPAYIFLNPAELSYVFYQGFDQGYTGAEGNNIKAVYEPGIIFLSEQFELGKHDAVLLHELVHHKQYEDGRKYPCVAASEEDAYLLQNAYIDETGTGEKSDPVLTFFARQCEEPY